MTLYSHRNVFRYEKYQISDLFKYLLQRKKHSKIEKNEKLVFGKIG
jgi:hypothetical protein